MAQKIDNPQIRVINNSGFSLNNVTLFSMHFKDLQPKDTSAYKELKYDPLRHDPLIYCMHDGINYGRYLKIPEKEIERYTYVIDSIKNRMVYISSAKDD